MLQLLGQKEINGGQDLVRTYVGLLADNYGDGLVEVQDEEDYATVAGFTGRRGLRSWRERVKRLHALGFLELELGGTGRVNFVCIVSPQRAVEALPSKGFPVSPDWQRQFDIRLIQTGGTPDEAAPEPAAIPAATRGASPRVPW